MNSNVDMRRVNRCLRWLVNETFEFYDSNKLPEKMLTRFNSFYDSVSELINWECLTQEDVMNLGFLNWESDYSGVWFIPKWLFPIIPEGLTLFDRNFNKFQFYKAKAPRETMYGCLTFGVILPNENDEETK